MNIRNIKYIQPRYQRRLFGRNNQPSLCACAAQGVDNCLDKRLVMNEPVMLVRYSILTTENGQVWYKNIRFRPECFALFMQKCTEDTIKELNDWHINRPVEEVYKKKPPGTYGNLDEQQTHQLKSWRSQVAGYRNRLRKYLAKDPKTDRTLAAIQNVNNRIIERFKDVQDLERIARGEKL